MTDRPASYLVRIPSTLQKTAACDWVPELRRALRSWFRRHARDLPWRRTRDPYAIWVSEIMLQQTQVSTVIPYYQRFLAAFPDIETLASASEQEVLRLWEGLGYYRRARQLHAAARTLRQQFNGRMPSDLLQIQSLAGIGRYTAGAIASIAFGLPAPILEANTIRLWSRLAGIRDDVSKLATQRQLWSLAETVLDESEPGEINQALMEIGGQVCFPQDPRCESCPLAAACVARSKGLQSRIPHSPRKTLYEEVREVVLVVSRRDEILVRQCQGGERWAGLWDFPRFRVGSLDDSTDQSLLAKQCVQLTGVRPRVGRLLTTIRHGVTRFRITLECYAAGCAGGKRIDDTVRWIPRRELGTLPLSVTARKIARLIEDGSTRAGR